LSGMSKIEPIVGEASKALTASELALEYDIPMPSYQKPKPSDSGRVVSSTEKRYVELSGIMGDDSESAMLLRKTFLSLSPRSQKMALKSLREKAQSLDRLYSICLGLPRRIRSFVQKIWKREDKWGESWDKIATEMAPEAAKILTQRVDVSVYTGIAIANTSVDRGDPKLLRMVLAKSECDALLCLYAHYFTIGMTAPIGAHCSAVGRDDPTVAGVVDVADYGAIEPARRRTRQLAASREAESHGWKLPERRYKK